MTTTAPHTTSHRLDFLDDTLAGLKAQNLYQSLETVEGPTGPEITMDGQRLINFASNNYLNLATHPKLKQAAIAAIERYGVGAGAVRTISGTLDIHQALEQKLAEFKGVGGVLVFQSGFSASQAAITSLMEAGDAVISDALNHACIIDGMRLLRDVDKVIYPHSDMAALEAALQKTQSARRRLVITDGVFSMDGDLAKLPEIVALAEQYNAMVMVDDAHGSGVFGKDGRGTVDHFGLHGRVDINVGTMSKAFGAMGGYIASTAAMRELLVNKARPFLFSTPHPPGVVASCLAALEVLQTEPERMARLWENTRYFKGALQDLGYRITSDSPILPVILGESEQAWAFSRALREAGIYTRAIVFPTVAKDKARIRLMMNADHTRAQLDKALSVFQSLR